MPSDDHGGNDGGEDSRAHAFAPAITAPSASGPSLLSDLRLGRSEGEAG